MKKRAFSCLLMVAIIISLLQINIYAEETTNNNNQTTQTLDNLTLLTPEHVQSLIDELNNPNEPTPRLTVDDILSSRTIYTTDNSPLQALTVRPLTQSEIEGYLYDTSVYCQTMTILYEDEEDCMPTSSYNCHYYAWCRDWCDEEYWINRAEPIVDDVHTTTFLNEENVQIGDIVTYWVNDECKHSAIVYSFVNGRIFCKSKWGANGLFIHPIDDVPAEYKENGQKNVKFHRYDHGIHFWGWNKVSDTQHEWKCNRCTVTTNARAPHDFQNIDRYNDSGHQMYCYDCSYGYYEEHELYISYLDDEGCDVRCRSCSYMITCYELPIYSVTDSSGHTVSCPGGCYSFYEEHSFNYLWLPLNNSSRLYYHNATCSGCGESYQLEHTWVTAADGSVECSDCGLTSTIGGIGGIQSLSDEELELYLSTLSDAELEAFFASLPEADLARVTALLPPDDDELVTE